jgi:hypothetical protein
MESKAGLNMGVEDVRRAPDRASVSTNGGSKPVGDAKANRHSSVIAVALTTNSKKIGNF